MNEFDLIRKIDQLTADSSDVKIGIGDDAAVVPNFKNKDVITTVDTLCEGIHFKRSTLRLYDIGYKALAVNLSDIAAMGGKPRYYLVSLAISSDWEQDELLDIYRGMNDLANHYNVILIGGDSVTSKSGLTISITVLGEIETDHSLLRSSAREGDVAFVSGILGESRAGLEILLEQDFNERNRLTMAHQRPEPQVILGQLLKDSGYRVSLNDISDGLSSEVWELAEASHVSFCLKEDKIPISKEAEKLFGKQKALDFALNGGEDFQLVGTVEKSKWPDIEAAAKEKGLSLTAIGTVEGGSPSVFMRRQNGERIPLKQGGYRHQ
ncbi:thiamine-phosphate kinase [Natribacillus halophilus]|uniref:Thiamine-monophosphate kinase n=1 Tax=Natribacillus halophilus TaxID=549003 RepID=A0A1G8SPY7_9BACI|nr:thiamine-phosphate kinase [Natribacillus halophilus]SDJ31309.1 thiamine-phosphate kinase [Natribacillus halophilus]